MARLFFRLWEPSRPFVMTSQRLFVASSTGPLYLIVYAVVLCAVTIALVAH